MGREEGAVGVVRMENWSGLSVMKGVDEVIVSLERRHEVVIWKGRKKAKAKVRATTVPGTGSVVKRERRSVVAFEEGER